MSLDKDVHLLTLRFLATTALDHLDPELVLTCFYILVGCVSTTRDKVVVAQGLERLVGASVLAFLHVLSHLTRVDPTSEVLIDVQRQYIRIFPSGISFEGLPSRHHFNILRNLFDPSAQSKIQWKDYDLLSIGHVAMASLVQYRSQMARLQKVPRWTLHFALHFLSQDPLPPPSVVVDCLSIIAIDLGCAVSDIATLTEKYVHT